MCDTCGCNEGNGAFTIINPADHSHTHSHIHEHKHEHELNHDHDHHSRRISLETDVLQQNDLIAQRNRGYCEARGITMLNLVSSPGSGKTTLLEKTIHELNGQKIYVIEGDQQTSIDAERIHATGIPVLQVNTGNGCHLDATMVHNAVKTLNPQEHALLLVENVGNLVCPALFDLGEQFRVVIVSVTEGEDKPLKYPNIFHSSHLCVINKMDLLPYVDLNLEKLKNNALKVNASMQFIEVSARTGEGFKNWVEWIKKIQTVQ